MSDYSETRQRFLTAGMVLAAAQTAEAEAFIRYKTSIKGCTDGQAERMAVVDTRSDAVSAGVALEVARHDLAIAEAISIQLIRSQTSWLVPPMQES